VHGEDFRRVVADWLSSELPELLERDVQLPVDSGNVVAVVGPRRAGKTSLMLLTVRRLLEAGIPRNNVLYVDFENPRLTGLDASSLDDMMVAFIELARPAGTVYLFLDEIQVVSGYGRWIRSMERRRARIYISGSTSSLTPGGIAEELRGRSISYELLPLSFREYLRFVGVDVDVGISMYTHERGRVLSALRDYLMYGSYPGVVRERDKLRLLRSYFESVVVRDFPDVQSGIAEAFLRYVVSNYARPTSVNRIYSYLREMYGVGKETVMNLFRRGKETFFLFPVQIFLRSERGRETSPKKIYIVDTGYPAALGYDFSVGRAMENAVFLELIRRGRGEIYYWREYGRSTGLEVDFVVSRNFEPLELIQVTYASSEAELDGREVRALRKAMESLGVRRGTVITWDLEREEGDVSFVPLWRWLLEEGGRQNQG
jgi:predicted AAA+ superfamily ATPase